MSCYLIKVVEEQTVGATDGKRNPCNHGHAQGFLEVLTGPAYPPSLYSPSFSPLPLARMNNVSKGSALFSAMTSTLSATAGGSGTMEEEVRQLYSQLSTPIDYPFYYRHTTSLLPYMSDKYLSLLAPIIIYWVGSLWFFFLDTAQFPFFEKYRLHEPQEISLRNRVSAKRVVVMVLLQQVVQTMLGLLFLDGDEVSYMQVFQDHEANVAALGVKVANMLIGVAGFSKGVQILHVMGPSLANWLYWWGIPAVQFLWAL